MLEYIVCTAFDIKQKLQFMALPYMAMPYMAMPYMAKPCMALPYMALPYMALPCRLGPGTGTLARSWVLDCFFLLLLKNYVC